MKRVHTYLVIILLTIIYISKTFSQDWPTSPEIWSKPVLLDSALNLKWKWYDTPAFTKSLDTIYYTGGNGVFRAIREVVDGKTYWDTIKLNNKVNPSGYAVHRSSISRDGRRLYISSLGGYGGADIWRSDWDTTTKDWNIPINIGNLNTASGEGYLYEVNPDTVYVISNHIGLATIYYYVFDKQKNEWAIADSFDNVYKHPFRRSDKYGLSLTGKRNKLYFGQRYVRDDVSQPLNYALKRKIDLAVSYWDSTKNTWGDCYYLNINSMGFYPDSIKWPTFIAGGEDSYPWISEDGKVLIFTSIRDVNLDSLGNGDTYPKLYISYLLKDENGNPVAIKIDKNNNLIDFHLFPNYPNPFNGSTIISYNLPKQERVTLKIYDIIGKEVVTLLDKEISTGMHSIAFNPQQYNLASGVYIYSLETSSKQISNNMVYLK